MSIIYTVRSFSSTTAKYDDPTGASNFCVFDTLNRLHRERELTYRIGEEEFKKRQNIYEQLLVKKHGASEMTRLRDVTEKTLCGTRQDTELCKISFVDGFSILKEVVTEYYSDRVDNAVTYYILKEGWDMDDPMYYTEYVGVINMYRKRV